MILNRLPKLVLQLLEVTIHVIDIAASELSLQAQVPAFSLVHERPHLLLEKRVLGLDLLDNENDFFGPLRQQVVKATLIVVSASLRLVVHCKLLR